jgi:hypothetical protein
MMKKRQPLKQMLWETVCRRLKLDLYLHPLPKSTQSGSRTWPETLKQLQEVVGNTLELIGIGNAFLSRTQKAQHLRESMNKWDCIKLKSFCTEKEKVTRLKRQHTQWEKIFASYSFDKGLISKIY